MATHPLSPPLPKQTILSYRTAGTSQHPAMLGCGFMRKPGKVVDCRNSCHAHYSAVYLVRGKGTYYDEKGASFPLQPGAVFQRFPQSQHTLIIDPSSDWAEYFVALDTETQISLARTGVVNMQTPVFHPGLNDNLIEQFARLLGFLQNADEPALSNAFVTIAGLLLQLRTPPKPAAAIDTTSQLIEEVQRILSRAQDSRLPLPQLLKKLPIRYDTLRKTFRARTGISLESWRLRNRLDAAAALLTERRLAIKDISFRLGYSNPYAFSAQFRKFFGVSPRQFSQGRIFHPPPRNERSIPIPTGWACRS
ncbi:MAG: helix-turn-helix transcriptional regulator [Verrucomicrobiae bacterium]|nr:helix-turn-helix transcriptional regulator [Verrucomicrobiae bacterium]